MLFVLHNDFTSGQLRGAHIAEALKAKCLFADIDGARNQNVLFVKDADRGLVLDAKDRGNRIFYDPIDLYCYKERVCPFEDLVDVLVIPNRSSITFYGQRFQNASFSVIPHQWDRRITSNASQDSCRTAYIGKGFNLTVEGWDGARITNSKQFIEAAPIFNLHLSLNKRDEKSRLLKPATKIATASAVLANVVSFDDPGAVELLGWDYPYLVGKDWEPVEAIKYAQKTFGSPTWKRGRERMKEVKEKTSLQSIAKLYRRLDEGDTSMLLREAA